MVRALRVVGVLACVALGAAGCGGESGNAGANPASVVPADAAVYVEAHVQPEGDRLEDVRAAARKILRTDDPDGRIRELVDKALREEDASFARDVEPWLGERAGIYLTRFERDEPDALIAVAATDTEKAEKTIRESIERERDTPRTERKHRDARYWVDRDGFAIGVVGDFVVFGDQEQFKRAVDASEGSALSEADRYRDAVKQLPEERIGHFFLDVRRLFEAIARSPGGEDLGQVTQALDLRRLAPVAGAVLADGNAVAIETVTEADGGGLFGRLLRLGAGESTPLLPELPGDAWLAFGAPKVGETLRTTLKEVAGAFGGAALTLQLQRELGIDLEEDVLGWMGDAALFVRGTDEASAEGAIVVAVTDVERARRALPKLVGLARSRGEIDFQPARVEGAETAFVARLPGESRALVVAVGGERMVLAFGEAAARDALRPGAKLGDAPVYDAARRAAGGDPSLLVDMPTLLRLIETSAGSDPDFQAAKPYLETLSVIAAAARRDGDRLRSRLAVGLK